MYEQFRDGNQDYYAVTEDIWLISADTESEARNKAEILGKKAEYDSDTWVCDDRPAIHKFAGVRKLVRCVDADHRPKDGTELSYSAFLAEDKESFDKLLSGESVVVEYQM